jgi:hypothetical protein
VFPHLDHRRKEVYGVDHPQGSFPCLCAPRSLAIQSLHYLGKCSNIILTCTHTSNGNMKYRFGRWDKRSRNWSRGGMSPTLQCETSPAFSSQKCLSSVPTPLGQRCRAVFSDLYPWKTEV